jgi:hypothetical protein
MGPVHPAYNPSFSAYFSVEIVLFSHTKLINNIFQPIYQSKRGHGYARRLSQQHVKLLVTRSRAPKV